MGYDVDNGYDMWEEVKEYYKKAWGQRIEPFALSEFMDAVSHLVAYDVKRALRRIYRTQERSLRPSIKQVRGYYFEIRTEDRRKNHDRAAPKVCKHCHGGSISLYVYLVPGSELPEDFKPNALMKEYFGGHYIVKPEAAIKKGMDPKAANLWCNHCKIEDRQQERYAGFSVRDFVPRFEGFYVHCFPTDRLTVDRILGKTKEMANASS